MHDLALIDFRVGRIQARSPVKFLKLCECITDTYLAEPIDDIERARCPLISLVLMIDTECQLRNQITIRSTTCPKIPSFLTKPLQE